MDVQTAYNVLGIDSFTSDKDVKKAWRDKVRQWHPDQNPNLPDAANRIQEINSAYEFLQKNSQTQLTETVSIQDDWTDPYAQQSADFGSFDANPYVQNVHQNNNFYPSPGENIETEVLIDLSDALKGIDVSIDLEREVPCPLCGGQNYNVVSICNRCKGLGREMQEEGFFVTLPAGISDEDVIRIEGAGNAGFWGGQNGDLLLKVIVDGNSLWEKKDETLFLYNIPLALEEMVLGTTLTIPTPKGWRHMRLKGPINVQKTHRIPNAGLNKPDGSIGDLIISFRLIMPQISETSKKDFENFVESLPVQNVRKKLEEEWKPLMEQL